MIEVVKKRFEGMKTDKVLITVTRENIRHYCHVIEEDNQVFHDRSVAKKAGYSDLPVPPTYPTLFWQYIDIPWLTAQSSTILTEPRFIYEQQLIANMTYACSINLYKVSFRGNKCFLKQRLQIEQGEKVIATSDTTLILQKEGFRATCTCLD